MPRCSRPFRVQAGGEPGGVEHVDGGGLSSPARKRPRTNSDDFALDHDGLDAPSRSRRWERSNPAGLAPMIATRVFMASGYPAGRCRR